jgi:hypothetical protein
MLLPKILNLLYEVRKLGIIKRKHSSSFELSFLLSRRSRSNSPSPAQALEDTVLFAASEEELEAHQAKS